MATSGELIIGVKPTPPIFPKEETVNVAPIKSLLRSFLLIAFSASVLIVQFISSYTKFVCIFNHWHYKTHLGYRQRYPCLYNFLIVFHHFAKDLH